MDADEGGPGDSVTTRVQSRLRGFVRLVAGDWDRDVFGELIAVRGDLTHLFEYFSMMVALAAFLAHPRGNIFDDD